MKGFSGCLITDGYAGYNQVQKVTHCGCWTHARRKWREAMPDSATVKTSKAAVGFRYCTKLFSLEKKYIYADVKARKEYRQNVVLPLLEEYFAWLKSIHPEKGSKLAISDAGTGAVLCWAAMYGAALNVLANTRLMKDRLYAEKLNNEVEQLMQRYWPVAEQTYDQVYQKLKQVSGE